MISSIQNIKTTFNRILQSSLCRIDGEEIDLCESIIELCDAIDAYCDTHDDTESIWYIGDYGEFCLSDFLVGAYWSLTEHHDGQASESYAAMCSIGDIFDPGMSNGPEEDSSEGYAHELCNQYFDAQNKQCACLCPGACHRGIKLPTFIL